MDYPSGREELPDEPYGNLLLKRKAGGTGYMFVTGPKPKSKKNPYQARIMNNRIGRTQSLGSFPTAHAAAVAVAIALANGENEDMDSPKKRRQRGVLQLLQAFRFVGPAAQGAPSSGLRT